MYEFEWWCKKCNSIFKQRMFKYQDKETHSEPRCLKCNPLIYDKDKSNFENELFLAIKEIPPSNYHLFYHKIINRNTIFSPNGLERELDIIITDFNNQPCFAFEANGIFYHDIKHKPLNYHLEKTIACEEKNIRLIHIWEDEWLFDKNKIINFIKNALQFNDTISQYIKDDKLILPRDKFNINFQIKEWILCEITKPKIIERHEPRKNTKFNVEDCGELIYKKI